MAPCLLLRGAALIDIHGRVSDGAERGPKKGMRKDLSLELARSLEWRTDEPQAPYSPPSPERRRSSSLHTLHPLNGAHIARGNILHGDGILKLRAKGALI